MPVSLHKKLVRGRPYWYARECKRVNGHPTIVWQKYLGKAQDIATAMGAPIAPPPPTEVVLSDFGGPAALYDLSCQLGLIPAIDRHAGKRVQGVGVGTYIVLAAINRSLAPRSKARMAAWYEETVLRRLLPVSASQLTSQRFWDHMNYLDAPKIAAIEKDITRTLVRDFRIDLSCLLYDTTNFFTYIDTFNDAPDLAQRGKSKEKRSDLRIVGLALLVTKDFHIPLFHEPYAGNVHDAPTFGSVTETLVERYRIFQEAVDDITLVYDKGNNSEANQSAVDESPFHFVGSLCPAQHPDLLKVRRSRYSSLEGEDLEGVLAWRTKKKALGAERTIIVTYNPELFLKQSQTIVREMRKRTAKLRTLQLKLKHPPAKGRARTLEAVQKNVDQILKGRHMKDLIQVDVRQRRKKLQLHYGIDRTAWNRLQRTLLGINILFTDQDAWSDEEIVRAYRGQHHVEQAFKTMKNPHFVSWRPQFHWTDSKIRVHAFYCVLALLLPALLRRMLTHKGIEVSVACMLEALSKIKEVALIYPGATKNAKPVISYSKLDALQKKLVKALDLDRFRSP